MLPHFLGKDPGEVRCQAGWLQIDRYIHYIRPASLADLDGQGTIDIALSSHSVRSCHVILFTACSNA